MSSINFLSGLEISQQQPWLNADAVSVSSLEVDSEYGESDYDSNDTDYSSSSDESSDSGSCSCCSHSCTISSCSYCAGGSLSEEITEEDEPPPQQPVRRLSRQERIKAAQSKAQQEEQQQRGEDPQENPMERVADMLNAAPLKSALRKAGVSTPDLFMRTGLGALAKGSNRSGGNAKWATSSGAKKAALSLLNDTRIGATSSKNRNQLPGLASFGMKKGITKQLVDVSIKQTKTTTTRGPTKTTSLSTTLNVTTVSVSTESPVAAEIPPAADAVATAIKKNQKSSTPNLPGFRRSSTGPADINPKSHRERRTRRRNKSSGEAPIPRRREEGDPKPIFRRCVSDPASLIPYMEKEKKKNDRWSSISPTNSQRSSGRVRLDDFSNKKHASPEVMLRMQQTPARIRRKNRQSAPNLTKEPLSTMNSNNRNQKPVVINSNARWSASPLPSNSPLADDKPKIPRSSAPDLTTLRDISELGDSSTSQVFAGVNARWSSTPKRRSAPNLLDLSSRSNTSTSDAPDTTTLSKPLGRGTSSSLRRGVQRSTSHMVNASAPNLQNIRRTVTIPSNKNQGNAQWGVSARPKMSSTASAGLRMLGSGLATTPSSRPGVQRTDQRMHTGKMVRASAPNLANLNLRKPTPKRIHELIGAATNANNAQWGESSSSPKSSLDPTRPLDVGLGMTRSPSSLLKRRGVQRTDSRMTSNKMKSIVGASAPNLTNLNMRRTLTIPAERGANAQWQPSNNNAQQLGSGLTKSPSLSPRRPGVQRTDSRMTSNKKNSIVGASAPNLMNLNLQRTLTLPQQSRGSNAQWQATTQNAQLPGRGLTRNPSSFLKRPGVQRTDSRMTSNKKNSIVGASAPNLMNLNMRRTLTMPETGGSNAQWQSSSHNTQQLGRGLTRNPSSFLKRPGVQRTDSRMTSSKKNSIVGASAPNLTNLNMGRTLTMPETRGANAQWQSSNNAQHLGKGLMRKPSSLLRRPGVQRTDSRMTSNKKNSIVGASAPNLMNLNLRRTLTMPESGGVNAQWQSSSDHTRQVVVGAGGLQRTPSSLLKRPGVQRTDSRMTSNKNNSIVGASAPNLMNLNLRRTLTLPQSGGANAQWQSSGDHTQGMGGGPTRSPLSLLKRPGVQRSDSRMIGNRKNSLVGASAPNLGNLQMSADTTAVDTANAQWGLGRSVPAEGVQGGLSRVPLSRPSVRKTDTRMNGVGVSAPNLMNLLKLQGKATTQNASSTNAQSNSKPSLNQSSGFDSRSLLSSRRPGVQRTTSHMVRGSKLANASAPNLLNVRRTVSIPQGRPANVNWTPNAAANRLRSALGLDRNIGGLKTNTTKAPIATSMPLASILGQNGNVSEGVKSSLLRAASNTRQGRQLGLSTPDLLSLAQSSGVAAPAHHQAPQRQNAQWTPNASTTASSLAPHPKMKTSLPPFSHLTKIDRPSTKTRRYRSAPDYPSLDERGEERCHCDDGTGAPTPSRWDNASTFDVTSLYQHVSTNTAAGERPKSPPNSSQLLRNHSSSSFNSSHSRGNRSNEHDSDDEMPEVLQAMAVRSRIGGSSAPNLLTTARVYSKSGSQNAGWNLRKSPRVNQQQQGWSLAEEGDATMRQSLEAILDHSRDMFDRAIGLSDRQDNGSTGHRSGSQVDQWSTTRRVPRRERHACNKSKKKKKKSSRRQHRHLHNSKKDDAPQIRRNDTDSSALSEDPLPNDMVVLADAAPVPIRRQGTDEAIETSHKADTDAAMVNLVQDVADFIASELENHSSSPSELQDVADYISSELENHAASTSDPVNEAVSMAAMEISRCAHRVIGNIVPSCYLDFNEVAELGCYETIPEHPHQSDDSVALSNAQSDDDDTVSHAEDNRRNSRSQSEDKQMKVPMRCESNPCNEHDSEDDMPDVVQEMAQRKKKSLRMPQRRQSMDLQGVDVRDTAMGGFLVRKEKEGEDTNSKTESRPRPAHLANRLPKRKPSIDTTGTPSQLSQATIMEDSVAEHSSLCAPRSHVQRLPKRIPSIDTTGTPSQLSRTPILEESFTEHSSLCAPLSHVHRDSATMADCSDITMPHLGPSSHASSASHDFGDISSPAHSGSLKQLVPGLGSNPGSALQAYLASPASMSRAGSLGSLKAKLALSADGSSSISKSSSVSSGLLGSLKGENSSKSSSKLASLRSTFGLMNDSSRSLSSTSSNLLGNISKSGDASSSIRPKKAPNMFGSITNDVFSMIAQDLTSPKVEKPAPKAERPLPTEKGEVYEDITSGGNHAPGHSDDEDPSTVTSAGCPTSETRSPRAADCNDSSCTPSSNGSKCSNNALQGRALSPRREGPLRILRDGAVM